MVNRSGKQRIAPWHGVLALALATLLGLNSIAVAAQSTPVTEPPSFDLSGVSLRVTTAAETLEMPASYMWDLMEGWGAEVERIELTSTTGVQALLANQADLAGQGTDELILGAAEGADLVGFASTKDKMDYVMVVGADINSVQDLAGKTIGMSGPAGFDTLLARATVRQAGMNLEDVNFVQIGGSPDRAAALLTGRIDAAVVFIPDWNELALRTDEIKSLLYMTEVLPGAAKSLVFTKREWLEANPEVALGDLDVTYDELIELDMYPLNPDDLLRLDGIQAVADSMLENGDIQNPVEATQIIDRSFLEEAAAMGCGAAGVATPVAG